MILSTTNTIEGKPVNDYLGIVTGETIIGANIFKDFFASIRDIVGGRSGSYERVLREAKDTALKEMKEEAIKLKMANNLIEKGIVIEAVLMKSIQLPRGLSSSTEQKLQAEQDAMRMVFVLDQARLEAERKIIESTGERDAQKILSEGLTEEIIKIRSIEAFMKLSNSVNSKVIITDGKAPFLIGTKE
mgnify:CR=1 FL=1